MEIQRERNGRGRICRELKIGKVARVLPARRSHLMDFVHSRDCKEENSSAGLFNDYMM